MTDTGTLQKPAVHTASNELSVLGTDVTLIAPLRTLAESELGIRLNFTVLDGIEAQRRGALQPDSFDIYDQWFHDLDLVWPARSLKPIDVTRINRWSEVLDLPVFSSGTQGEELGSNPRDLLFVQADGELNHVQSARISMLPTVYNADSFAVIGGGAQAKPRSWADLLSSEWCGRVAIQADAAIGVLDLLLAMRAGNQFQARDIGNLDLAEIEQFIRLVRQSQLQGQFYGFWTDTAPVLGADEPPILSTMWWANFLALRARGVQVEMCTPTEGYRGWFGGMALSRCLSGRQTDIAYEYLNWWLSGGPGALMARNGAYAATPQATRSVLSSAEWDFWYEGKAAASDMKDPFGNVVFRKGERREGGASAARLSRIVTWNSVMDEHNLLVRLWEAITREGLL